MSPHGLMEIMQLKLLYINRYYECIDLILVSHMCIMYRFVCMNIYLWGSAVKVLGECEDQSSELPKPM